jgi:hypothetical protein
MVSTAKLIFLVRFYYYDQCCSCKEEDEKKRKKDKYFSMQVIAFENKNTENVVRFADFFFYTTLDYRYGVMFEKNGSDHLPRFLTHEVLHYVLEINAAQ